MSWARKSNRQNVNATIKCVKPLLLAAVAAVPMVSVYGATATWVGNSSTNWSQPTEWSLSAPVTGDALEFGVAGTAGTTLVDDLMTPATFSISGIIFTNAASAYTINPLTAGTNGFTLTGELINNSTNTQTINSNITLSGVRTVTTTAGGGDITLGGVMNAGATSSLLKTGQGTLNLTGSGLLGNTGASGVFPLNLREGAIRINTSGTYNVTGEAAIGDNGAGGGGNNVNLTLDAGTLNISTWLSIARGNGTGGVSSDVVLNGSSQIITANMGAGFNANNALNLPKASITLNDTSKITVTSGTDMNIAESAGSVVSVNLNGSSQLLHNSGTTFIGKLGSATLNINNTSTGSFNGVTWVGYRTGSGTINVSGGTFFSGGEVRVGYSDLSGTGNNAQGIFNMTGGVANVNGMNVGRGNNNQNITNGTVNLSGGTLNSTGDIILGFAGTTNFGRVNITGGVLNLGTPTAGRWIMVGNWDTAKGQVDISNGTFNLLSGSSIKMNRQGGNGGVGGNVINQTGGWVNFFADNGTTLGGVGDLDMQYAGATSSVNTYNLDGGTLTVPRIRSSAAAASAGTRVFNFNGGTLRAAGDNASWVSLGTTGTVTLNVRNGGAIIDTNGANVTVAHPLTHSAISGDAAIDGGLTKRGLGTLTLTGANNTYTGPTLINAGRLAVTGNLSATSGVTVASGASFNPRGNITVAGGLSSSGTLDLNDLAAGTFSTGSLILGNSSLNFEFAGGVTDRISVTNGVTATGTNTINLSLASGAINAGTYTLATAASGLNSGFTIGAKPPGFFAFSLAPSTATSLVLSVAGNPTPTTAFWTGLASADSGAPDANRMWGYGSTLSTAKSNWSTTADGLTDPLQVPGPVTDVTFTASNAVGVAGVLNTKLDSSYSIQSLKFDVPASTSITSAGVDTNAQTLTLGTGGLTQAATSNASANVTGTGQVRLLAGQTWRNDSNSLPLNVSAPISAVSGATTLVIGGDGTGGVNLSGPITNGSGTVSLILAQLGNTTLSGGASTFSNIAVRRGTGILTTGAVVNTNTFSSIGAIEADQGTLTLNGSAVWNQSAEINVGDVGTTSGTLNIADTAQLNLTTTAGILVVGSANAAGSTAAGVVNQTGGAVNVASTANPAIILGGRVAAGTLGTGVYNLSGGTLTSAGLTSVGHYGSGTVNQTGGNFNANNWLVLGRFAGGKGVYNISNGTLTQNLAATGILIGQDGDGTMTVSGNARVSTATGVRFALFAASAAVGNGTLNLDGGWVTTPLVEKGIGTSGRLYFNGGTLQASATSATFMQGLTSASVKSGAAIIDTQVNNITIAQPILHDASVATDGGLTKHGTGQLTLTGANTYNGPTVVKAGSLAVTNAYTGFSSGGGSITVEDGAALTTTVSTAGASLGASNLTVGTTAGGTLNFSLGTGNPTVPVINLSGNLVRVGNNIVNVSGTGLSSGTITLIQYAGTESGSGSFSLGNLPNNVSGTLFDLGAGKVDLSIVSQIPKWTGLGDGTWAAATQSPENWVTATSNVPMNYTSGDAVLFSDYATGTTTVNIPATVTPGGVTVNNSTLDYTLTGAAGIEGTGGLLKTGTRKLTISNLAPNTYSGGTTINGGTVELAGVGTHNGAMLGSGPIVNNGVIDVTRTTATEFAATFIAQPVSGTGSIVAGQNLVLSGLNTFDGTVTVKTGAGIFLDSATALGSTVGNTVVEDGGRVAIFQGNPNFGAEQFSIVGNGPSYGGVPTNGAVYVGSGQTATMGGTITMTGATSVNTVGTLVWTGGLAGGSFDLTKNGGGRLTIASPATYGQSNVAGGALQIGNGGTLGNVGTGDIVLTNGTIDFNRSDTYTVSNKITNIGAVVQSGPGTTILDSVASDFFGQIIVNNGTLDLAGIGYPSTMTVNGNGVMKVSNDLYGLLTPAVVVTSNNAQTGGIELSGGLASPFSGGTITLSGRNNTSTGIRSANGTNALGGSIVLVTGGAQYRFEAAAGGTFNLSASVAPLAAIAGDRVVTFSGAGVGTMTGVISTGGAATLSLQKVGSGTWTMDAAHSYNGNTTVNGGTLVLKQVAQTPVLSGPGANIQNGYLVMEHTADGGVFRDGVETQLTTGYNLGTKFSAGTYRSSAADATKGLGWTDDGLNTTIGYAYYGDADLSGTVDSTDFNALVANYGKLSGVTWAGGDFDYNDKVNTLDFNQLAGNFGLTIIAPIAGPDAAPMAALGTVVPEPTTMSLLLVGGGMMLRRRSRR